MTSALTVFVLVLGFGATASGRLSPVDATHVKAQFLLNFLKFVEWPPDRFPADGEPFTIVVVGDPAFAAHLARQMNPHKVLGRGVFVRAATDVSAMRDAHLLFVAGPARAGLAGILRALDGRGVVTVGDTAGFGEAGVVLNLYVAGERMRFEANMAAAARAGVRLSSQLLRLARLVG